MKTEEDALALAGELARVGNLMGKRTAAFVTDMDVPLGRAMGNAIEVVSALDCLACRGPQDVMELVVTLGTAMLGLGKPGSNWQNNRDAIEEAVASGSGLERFRAMIEAQGGDPSVVDDPRRLPRAPVEVPVLASAEGYVTDLEPRRLGLAVVELGGGRRRAEDAVDHGVGIELLKVLGDPVGAGDTLAVILARTRSEGERVAEGWVRDAYRVGSEAPPSRSRVRYLVTEDGAREWLGPEAWPE
jgi:pyrimidine-nucleoside phosphorylase